MTRIKKVKVWSKNWNGRDGYEKEYRIYIDLEDGRRGGYFLTGNPYQEAGSLDGKLTSEDVEVARALVAELYSDGEWHTMYDEDCERAYNLREIQEHEAEAEDAENQESESQEPESQESEAEDTKSNEPESQPAKDDHGFFDDFFGAIQDSKECHKCGTSEQLVVDFTVHDTGEQVWVCRQCKTAKKNAQREKAAQSRQSVHESAARDRWEEPGI